MLNLTQILCFALVFLALALHGCDSREPSESGHKARKLDKYGSIKDGNAPNGNADSGYESNSYEQNDSSDPRENRRKERKLEKYGSRKNGNVPNGNVDNGYESNSYELNDSRDPRKSRYSERKLTKYGSKKYGNANDENAANGYESNSYEQNQYDPQEFYRQVYEQLSKQYANQGYYQPFINLHEPAVSDKDTKPVEKSPKVAEAPKGLLRRFAAIPSKFVKVAY